MKTIAIRLAFLGIGASSYVKSLYISGQFGKQLPILWVIVLIINC